MPLVDYKKGGVLSDREIKRRIQEATGWDNATYKKKYDVFRNKAVNFSQITGKALPYRTNELFYLQNASKARWGSEYRASELLKAIEQTTSESTGAATRRGIKAIEREYEKAARGEISRESISGEEKPVATSKAQARTYGALLERLKPLLNAADKAGSTIKKDVDALIAAKQYAAAYKLAREYADAYNQKKRDAGTKNGIRQYVGYD